MENKLSESAQKKKRNLNTSKEQYEVYIDFIQNDEVMRTGIINPTVGEDYLNIKWKELSEKLNCLATGPELSKEQWKKRFADWKNSVRYKLRKYESEKGKTGQGRNPLSDLEARSINVWGRNVVEESSQLPDLFTLATVSTSTATTQDTVAEEIKIEYSEVSPGTPKQNKRERTSSDSSAPSDTPTTCGTERPRTLNVPTERTLSEITSNQEHQNLASAIRELANVQREALRFEIQKFEFQNPNFQFKRE